MYSPFLPAFLSFKNNFLKEKKKQKYPEMLKKYDLGNNFRTVTTVKIMSVIETIKSIYSGPFFQYSKLSEKISGIVYDHSKLVEVLFLLEINFLDITQRYKKPIHGQEEEFFILPIIKQVGRVKTFRDEHTSSLYVDHLSLISESVEIFEWIQYRNIEELLVKVRSNIAPYLSKLRRDAEKLDEEYGEWLNSWNKCMESLSNFLMQFYQGGLMWLGSEKLPAQPLGDIPEVYRNVDHLALFQEINQGENITRILRQTNADDQSDTED